MKQPQKLDNADSVGVGDRGDRTAQAKNTSLRITLLEVSDLLQFTPLISNFSSSSASCLYLIAELY